MDMKTFKKNQRIQQRKADKTIFDDSRILDSFAQYHYGQATVDGISALQLMQDKAKAETMVFDDVAKTVLKLKTVLGFMEGQLEFMTSYNNGELTQSQIDRGESD